MTFWIIVICATALAAAIIVRPMLRRTESAAPRAAHDAQVFRDQLKELDKDLERGTVDADQADATRLEISRRLLAADAEQTNAEGASPAPRGVSRIAAVLLIIAAPAAAVFLYGDVGAPGAQDQPLASRGDESRPDQLTAEAMLQGEQFAPPAGPDAEDFRKLVTQLEQRLEDNPDDPQGVFLLGRSLMQLGRFAEAWPRFERAVELNPQISLEARAGLAEGMILATGGYISPQAEDALLELVKRDPTNESARYYLGRLHVQANEPEYARAIWGRLLADSPQDAPWVAPIQRELAQIGGTVPAAGGAPATGGAPALRGPSEDQIAAAQDLPQDERVDMVRTMVNGLAERIATEGGTIGEYVQLIRSWQVLREFARAEAVRAEALDVFAGNDDALAQLATVPASPDGDDPTANLQAAAPEIFEPETPAPGPDADDIAAAQDMAPNDRQAMIRGMVQRLDDRLTENGGSADEWLRLISSYSVLGDGPKAENAAMRARAALAGNASELSVLNAALSNGAAPEAPQQAAPASPGPTQEDIAAAQEMNPDDRQAMVQGMVSRLHERLTTDGRVADVNEWGKLMRAYKVLGDTDAIRAAYDEAVVIYDDDAISKAYLKEAALLNGVKFN